MKNILYLFILILFSSCTTNYYAMYIVDDTPVLARSHEGSSIRTMIPKGSQVYVSSGNSKYSKIKWREFRGWVPVLSYSNSNSFLLDSTINTQKTYSSPRQSSGGTVQVKGYYRKNGTYVRPHTRSAPRRR